MLLNGQEIYAHLTPLNVHYGSDREVQIVEDSLKTLGEKVLGCLRVVHDLLIDQEAVQIPNLL